ncbi:MAG: hypothetical protein MMC33_010880 [Icmadophila ericetorum]|nr:hypothetical protein [Icmadophila ericetorum]
MAPSSAEQQQISPNHRTALKLISAFNSMDISTILSLRSPTCQRIFLPQSMHLPAMNNAEYAASLHFLIPVFQNFELTLNEVVEDREQGKICLWLNASADTKAGRYENEYIWWLEFEDAEEEGGGDGQGGAKIKRQMEFVDSVMQKEFFPKLRASVLQAQKEKEEQEAGQ